MFSLAGELAIYRIFYPKCLIAEINTFLYTANIVNPFFSFYSPSQISSAETLIWLGRKKGCTTAYQAFYEVNLDKQFIYWNYAKKGIRATRFYLEIK